jgi:phosphatidylserine/phosphatidylglycerophosphate/cardiolipin synthase-like enzyme
MMKRILLTLLAAAPFVVLAQTSILDARTNYNVGDIVTVTGIVTSDANLGSVRYLQDETAGIALYPGGDWSGWPDPQPGDELTMTAELTEYNGLLEVGSANISNVEVLSTGNPLPEPQAITPAQMDESLEGQLVYIQGAMFTNGGQIISGNNTYSFSASGEDGVIYVRTSNELVGQVLSAGEVDLYGIVSQFSFDGFGGYQLLPRGIDDVVATSAINLATSVTQDDLATTSFSLNWLTDVEGDSHVEYGLTPELGSAVSDATLTQDHSVMLTDLTPGTIYYARVISVLGEDSTMSVVRPYATVSESPGWIRAYFVADVDNSVATIENAVALGTATNDTIAAYILSAEHTLDIAVYNTNNTTITNAVNQAAANGVQVRWIAEGQNANLGLSELDSSIPVHFRTDGEGSGMHNKFIIGDAEYTDNAFVLTGSTNWTTDNLNTDPNNLIIFGDESLAKAYTLEFNEMWGSEGMTPDAANSRFGPEKEINTPERFLIGGSPVELYFSPSDGTNQAILESILTTDYDFHFATLSFTRNDLGEAVIDVASSIFTTVSGAMEDVNNSGSEYDVLTAAGIPVYSHQGIAGQLHHKYGIVDHSQPGSDPRVITGSHNWSTTAETTNDENTVIVHDARIANLFYQEYMGLLGAMGVGVEDVNGSAVIARLFPNPTSGELAVDWKGAGTPGDLILRDMMGRVVDQTPLTNGITRLDLGHLPAGIYTVSIGTEGLPTRLVIE